MNFQRETFTALSRGFLSNITFLTAKT